MGPSDPERGGESTLPQPHPSAVAGWVLDQILVMLHPFMPFVTEELWNAMGERPYPLILAKWPMPDARALDPEAGPEIEWLIRLVSGIRGVRAELNIPPGANVTMFNSGCGRKHPETACNALGGVAPARQSPWSCLGKRHARAGCNRATGVG